jgi:hypothetical protein
MLSEQGELYRRYMGHEPGGILKIEGGGLLLSPVEAISLRTAVLESISRGLLREVEPGADEEIDLGLEELAKKTQAADARPLSAHGVNSGLVGA